MVDLLLRSEWTSLFLLSVFLTGFEDEAVVVIFGELTLLTRTDFLSCDDENLEKFEALEDPLFII